MFKYLTLAFLLFYFCSPGSAFNQINITFNRTPNTPYFLGQPEMNIDAEEFTTVVLRIKSDKSGTARLFWATNFDPRMNEPKSLWFFLDSSRDFKEYVFNVRSQNPNWSGFVGQLLVYPESGPEGIEIENGRAITGNLLTNIKSGWREFWGPRGRLIEGPTVNNMRALTLWGKPINFYIYGIILFAALLSFGYFFNSSKSLSFAWQNCGKITILAGIICWAMLFASQMVSEYHQFKLDLKRYDFNSLEEKRAIAVEDFGKDFYPFLMFCKENLPGRARAKFLSSEPTGYSTGRATYFLYPIDFFAKEPDYILIFNYKNDINATIKEYPGFKFFKKFNEGAYILWKK